MLLPEEIEAKSVIPSLRAMVAKRLTKKYELTQQEAAKLLGLTQAAISNYIRGSRGAIHDLEKIEEIRKKADEISAMLVNKADIIQILSKFHEACLLIRKQRLLCEVHKKLEPNYDVNNCHICEC
ncbi:hypothetical protein HRbin06_00871 [archaeon HR06]|nr:hypothetical protein HRbin06_00871 [archaeon HR06]